MKSVFIKYNPYKIETEIKVDGKKPAMNSKLLEKSASGNRLQEWVEELPSILIDEYNDNIFDVKFHGILQDYDDIVETFQNANKTGKVKNVNLDRIPAKETEDKEKLIDEVFSKIISGPFEELKTDEVKNTFELAKSEDFEICVVATMSSGKSTLINSMLGTKLMPSKQEACTAIITRIKDNDSDKWTATVRDKENNIIETHDNINLDTMNRLNSDSNVSTIEMYGNIPFVTSEDVSLVLIDTPGPNNSRDPEHGKVQQKYLNSKSKSLVLYIMTGTFGNDDDDKLLNKVAESMKVNGKQSKDRFIFVVNKMDDRRKEDGETADTLGRVREYLRNHGIENANLFPAAALPALNIKQMISGELDEGDDDDDEVDAALTLIKKLNRRDQFHLDKFAPLPISVKGGISNELKEAENADDKKKMALIHTGVPSIEAAIRQYVQKYAKTSKVKNIVDTFIGRLEAAGSVENTKKEIAADAEKAKQIIQQISVIEGKIETIRSAHDFERRVDDAVVDVNEETQACVEEKITQFQTRITQKIDQFRGQELDINDAEAEISRLEAFSKRLEDEFIADLDEIINDNLVSTADKLVEEYQNKLAALADEINISSTSGISVNPLDIMKGSFSNTSFAVSNHVRSKEVENGQEYVKNTDKKWYKPWTWFQESGYYRTKYKTVSYVDGSEIAQGFFAPIKEVLYDTSDTAKKHAIKESKKIVAFYKNRFDELDKLLERKLDDMKVCALDRANAEERLRESEEKLAWLNDIRSQVESILEI